MPMGIDGLRAVPPEALIASPVIVTRAQTVTQGAGCRCDRHRAHNRAWESLEVEKGPGPEQVLHQCLRKAALHAEVLAMSMLLCLREC